MSRDALLLFVKCMDSNWYINKNSKISREDVAEISSCLGNTILPFHVEKEKPKRKPVLLKMAVCPANELHFPSFFETRGLIIWYDSSQWNIIRL